MQAIATVLVAVLAGWWAGMFGAVSALLGGWVNISAGVVFAFVVGYGMSAQDQSDAGATLKTLFQAWAAKLVMIVVQLWLIITGYTELVAAAMFSAFAVTTLLNRMAFWETQASPTAVKTTPQQ